VHSLTLTSTCIPFLMRTSLLSLAHSFFHIHMCFLSCALIPFHTCAPFLILLYPCVSFSHSIFIFIRPLILRILISCASYYYTHSAPSLLFNEASPHCYGSDFSSSSIHTLSLSLFSFFFYSLATLSLCKDNHCTSS
jgi:hypothetical protein